jgi:argininosuccinate lyase
LQDLSLEELRKLNSAFDQDFYSHLSVQAVLGVHDVPGGTAPSRVRQALAEARKKISGIREEVHAHA